MTAGPSFLSDPRIVSRIALVATVLLAGCATTDGRQAGANGFIARAADATGNAITRVKRAIEDQDLQRKFHDAAEHGEDAVLAVLRRAGIGTAKAQSDGYGNVVIVRHAGDTTTLYAHNSELKVRTGQSAGTAPRWRSGCRPRTESSRC